MLRARAKPRTRCDAKEDDVIYRPASVLVLGLSRRVHVPMTNLKRLSTRPRSWERMVWKTAKMLPKTARIDRRLRCRRQ